MATKSMKLASTNTSRFRPNDGLRYEMRRPGQQSGRHLHPCAVLGYIVEGTATYEIEGEAKQILSAGSAFHEPAGAIIANFGNASASEPMTFVAFYLLNGDQELIQMLDSV